MRTSPDGRRITTKEATIRTAVVEIKSLTISGKQMTLAVFRQLQKTALMDWQTGKLRGLPWGTVNYHADCMDWTYNRGWNLIGQPHLHVVWQKGDELRQDLIPRDPQLRDGWSDEARRTFQHVYLTLEALDQLFIAV
jgi:hypothetical protein